MAPEMIMGEKCEFGRFAAPPGVWGMGWGVGPVDAVVMPVMESLHELGGRSFLRQPHRHGCRALAHAHPLSTARARAPSSSHTPAWRAYARVADNCKVDIFSLGCIVYGNFDIILVHFPRVSQLHPTPHAPCAMLHLVPMLVVC